MFKRILLPFDDSKAARLALKQAIDICVVHNAKLLVVHAIDYIALSAGVEGIDTETVHDEIKRAGEKVLDKALKAATKRKVKVEAQLIESLKLNTNIETLVVKAAKNWRADLVVVGMNKKDVLKKLFLGSHSEKLIHKISSPVLLVKTQ
ncbi:MAG: universal stress protein [Candidatus Berkiella sp.]